MLPPSVVRIQRFSTVMGVSPSSVALFSAVIALLFPVLGSTR